MYTTTAVHRPFPRYEANAARARAVRTAAVNAVMSYAPCRRRPLMNSVGVPDTPETSPESISSAILAASACSRSRLRNRSVSRPSCSA
jgi:hypothetical protein